MFQYLRQFFQESKIELQALKDIGFPIFLYQSLVRLFFIGVFGLLYSFAVYWVLKNPGEDYVFITGLATLNYIHIDRLFIICVVATLVFLLSFFIETFGVISLSRQYYLGERISLWKTFKSSLKYGKIDFKVQTLKYVYIVFHIASVGFVLYVLFLFLPNIVGLCLGIILVIQTIVLISQKIIEYKDLGQRVFEKHKTVSQVYNFSIPRERKKRILQFYIFKIGLIFGMLLLLPAVWLFLTWLICKMSMNHQIITSLLLGVHFSFAIVMVTALSYLYISFFVLRATRKYLEFTGEIADTLQVYSSWKFKNLRVYVVLAFLAFSGFQGLVFYDYFREFILPDKKLTIFAHRASMAQDTNNSLPALKYSIEQKIEFVEIDVQLSKEGIPVVFHDLTYFDGKQNKYVSNTPLAELKQFDLKTKKNTQNPEVSIPSLEEFLKFSKGKIKVNIEIKTKKNFQMQLAESVAEIINKLDMKDEVMVTSFDYAILQRVEEIVPKIQTGLVVAAYVGQIEEINDIDVDWLMVNDMYYALHKKQFQALENKKISLWSFETSYTGEDALYFDTVDGVIIDDPAALKKEMEKYNTLPPGEKYYIYIENLFQNTYRAL